MQVSRQVTGVTGLFRHALTIPLTIFLYSEILKNNTVITRINAAAFIKLLALKVRRLFEGGVYLRVAFIANFVTTSVHLLFKLKLNLNLNPKN